MLKLNKTTQTFLEVLLIYYLAQMVCPGMPDHTLQKLHNQTVTSMNVQLHAKNQYNNLNLSENTGNSLFRTLWASLGIPNHIQQKCDDQDVASMNV